MLKIKYIVWVGGVPDYEGHDRKKAEAILREWVAKGYDDAVIEKG